MLVFIKIWIRINIRWPKMLFIPEIEKNMFKRHRRTVSSRISPPMGNPQSGFFSAAGNWWHSGIACLKLTSFFHFEEQTAVRIGEPIKYWWEIEQEQVLEKNPRKMLHRRAMIEKKDKMEGRERKKGRENGSGTRNCGSRSSCTIKKLKRNDVWSSVEEL